MMLRPQLFKLLMVALLGCATAVPTEAIAQTQFYELQGFRELALTCLLYTSPSPRDPE